MKRRASFQQKSQHKWKRKPVLFGIFGILLFVCGGSLVFLEFQDSGFNLPMPIANPFVSKPKIAFLFIARNRMPLDFVWDAFFRLSYSISNPTCTYARGTCLVMYFVAVKNQRLHYKDKWSTWKDNVLIYSISSAQADNEKKFSIFVHSRPGFLFNKATTKSMYFLNRQVNGSVQVDWGGASMIQAERILLESALMDPSNERFVFLSDSCIPLYNFSYTYDYIMSTSTSFVDSFADTKEGRYNPKMHPTIPVNNWRKGSQWAVLNRKHAEVVVKDETVFPVFQQHCKRKSLPEFWRDQPFPVDPSKEHNCIPDEHYVQTLLAQEGLEGEVTRRSLTHTAWDLSASKDHERRGWHPLTYKFSDASAELIRSIKEIDNIYYETENRREWCTSKGKPAPCFLFARKFTRPAALRLLNMFVLRGQQHVA